MFDKLRRRELAAYTLLLERGGAELGEAIDLLSREMCTTKRTARRIIKRLRRLGLLRSKRGENGAILLEPIDPLEALRSATRGFLSKRWERCYAYSKREPPEEGQRGQ